MNEKHCRRYAELLVKLGVDLRPRQPLYIHGQVAHRRLIALLTEVAYEAGSGPVETRLLDPLQHAALIRHGRFEDIELFHSHAQVWYSELLRHGAAYICLLGPEIPQLWEEIARSCPERHAVYQRGAATALGGFQRYGLEGQCSPWVAATCPTPGWAKQVFANLPEDEACDRLAELIFQFTYADREEALELAAVRDRRLKARCRKLDELGITEIHVAGGRTDLRVGFSRKARWQGGSLKTRTGQTFYGNMPSVEVYTTPHRRLTEGRLAVTRPFRLRRGPVVRDLVLCFRGGAVVELDAGEGLETFKRTIETDEGARYLGEFALVSEDSSIAKSGLFFDLGLIDENASSHVALGYSYARPVSGGESMSLRELEELGCNQSAHHTDIMFGSTEITIVATESREGEVVLVDRGCWTERFVND
ncbi:MAG: aminopeptidase [bacterium]|nr:aminopeptidase [bacterium]